MSTAELSQQQAHRDDESHKVQLEEVPDESDLRHPEAPIHATSVLESSTDDEAPSWAAPISTKAAGKQKAQEAPVGLQLNDAEAFPGLGGAPKPTAATPSWNKSSATNGTNGNTNGSAAASGVSTPKLPSTTMNIPGRATEKIHILPESLLPRQQMKKPLQDVIKDVNRKSKAQVTMSTGNNGIIILSAVGPREACQAALKDITNQISIKQSITLPIPRSARGHVVGKGGATIKALQEKTGARINMPRNDESNTAADDDEDATVDVVIEGNVLTIQSAKTEIEKLLGDRAAATAVKHRGIPAEFYPFLAQHPQIQQLQNSNNNLRINFPQYNKWSQQRPPQPSGNAPASFTASHNDNPISLSGDRQAVQAARQQILSLAKELNRNLAVDQFPLQTGQHQFIIGKQGISADRFLAETGCHIIFPADPEDDGITVVGPVDKIQGGVERAMELATSMQSSNVDISTRHRAAGIAHARNVTRYLQQRKEIERLQAVYDAHIVTPSSSSGYAPWQLFYRDGKTGLRASAEINSIVNGHPPTRMANVPIDPFYYQHLQREVAPRVQENHGVLVVVPNEAEQGGEVLLVYEGPNATEADYQVPRTVPTSAEVQAFQRGLEDAKQHIIDLISAQEQVKTASIDVPQKFHEKLRKFIKREQEQRAATQIPIRVSATGTTVTLRGPASSVDKLHQKVEDFVAQEIEDEKERGYTMSFDFPQKHANLLIGSRGANINALREKFDVDIQVEDGQVKLTGPKAKAEAAKAHINSQGKIWADEVTHNLKVDQAFHRSIIGKGGDQINKLQDRYKVQIMFPRSRADGAEEDSVTEGKARRVQGSDEVIVRGPTKGADQARDEILSLLQYLKDTSNTASIYVPQSQIGSLMGAGGRNIDEIRATTGANINVPNSKDVVDPERIEIQIKGTKTQVAAAKKALDAQKAVLDKTVVKNLDVERKYHSALIGSGGNTLREIIAKAGGPEDRAQQNRTVQFPKAGAEGNSIQVSGEEAIVNAIISAMQEIVDQRESQVTEVIDVPIAKHRNLIGQGGKTKKDMETQFGVQINVPRQGDGSTAVRISGQPSNVEEAKAYIQQQTKEQAGETVQVPRSLHHAVADNGQFFRRLRNKKVIVDHDGHKVPAKPTAPAASAQNGAALPLITDDQDQEDSHTWVIVQATNPEDDGEIPWVLRGSPEDIATARQMLAQAITEAQLSTALGYLSLSDTSKHRYIIGTKGRKIDEIRQATGCKITVPREQGSYDPIEVSGSEEGVQRARDLMLEAIRDGGDRN